MSYLASAGLLLVGFAFTALLCLLLLRLLAQWWRVPFHNPLCQFLYRVTHPLARPLHRVLPNVRRVDLAVVALVLVTEVVKLLLVLALQGRPPSFAGLLVLSVAEVLDFLFLLYVVLIIIWALLSFLGPQHTGHPLAQFVDAVTAPVMRPLQRRLPTAGGIDFSPLVVLLALMLARILLVQPLLDLGSNLLR